MARFRAIFPLALAIVLALVASVVVYKWVQMKTGVQTTVVTEKAEPGGVQVALASADLPWGTKLTREMVKMAEYPPKHLPAGYFSDPAKIEGRVLVTPVKQGEQLLESKLAPVSVTTGGVSAVVSVGKRAIAVAGDKVIGLAGFIQPGNFVDVLVTIRDTQEKTPSTSKVVLENVKVLATGTVIDKKAGTEPGPVDVFTLEVTPEEAERLAFAASLGKLHFALRNVTDTEVVYTMGTTIADALDAYRPRMKMVSAQPVVKSEPEARKEPARTFSRMEIIKGSKVSQVDFENRR